MSITFTPYSIVALVVLFMLCCTAIWRYMKDKQGW